MQKKIDKGVKMANTFTQIYIQIVFAVPCLPQAGR